MTPTYLTDAHLRRLDVVRLLTGLKAPLTVQSYAANWAKYVEFAPADSPVSDARTLIAWRQHMIAETRASANTINQRLHAVKSVIRELAERGQVNRETAWAIRDVKTLKTNMLTNRRRANQRVRIQPEQMRGLVETPVVRLGDPMPVRNRALILLLATSGLRISEAIRVKVEDVQQQGGHYFIANILGKGASETRIAPLSAEAYAAIQDWLHVRPLWSEWLFISLNWQSDGSLLYTEDHMTRSAAYHVVKRVGEQFGMPEIKPHDLRRFVGTQLAKQDIRTAQRVLGHASIQTTAKYYVLDSVPLGTTEELF